MRLPATFSTAENEWRLRQLTLPLTLDTLVPGDGAWEVEIGFGKGRYLLERASTHPERRFLGLEVVSKYYRLLQKRARRRGLRNLLLIRGEALYLLATVLPTDFADRVHIYFPDPWPKSRHHRRRLFDPATVDLVIGVLCPGGELVFATDFIEYGEHTLDILRRHPSLRVRRHRGPWPDGARTHYEAKYMQEGRPILRLRAALDNHAAPGLHPEGRVGVLSAVTTPPPPAPA